MAIGKNKRLTKRVAASGGDSEDCSEVLLSAKRAARRRAALTASLHKVAGSNGSSGRAPARRARRRVARPAPPRPTSGP